MKAILYDVSISESVMDYLHGEFQNIREIYIPEANIMVNKRNVQLLKSKNRYSDGPSVKKIKDVEIVDDLVKQLLIFATMEGTQDRERKRLISSLSQFVGRYDDQ